MLFDGKVKKLRINGSVYKSFPGEKHVLIRRGGGEGGEGKEGGRGQVVRTPNPLKFHRNIGFHSKSGPDPLKKHKTTKLALNVWATNGTLTKRHLNGVLLAGRCWPTCCGIWIFSPINN